MNSRTDGTLTRVALQSDGQIVANYARYAPDDALCCPSSMATVVFEIDEGRTVQPVSVSTSSNL